MADIESWREVRDYDGRYLVSNHGRVMSTGWGRDKILRPAVAKSGGYLYVSLRKDGTQKSVKVHRLVAEAWIPNPDNCLYVDHKNGNRKDNHPRNLRWCTFQQNMVNRPGYAGSTSMYKGVSWVPHMGKWRARICDRHLGCFDTEQDAAVAYDAVALALYGEFTCLNFPTNDDRSAVRAP